MSAESTEAKTPALLVPITLRNDQPIDPEHGRDDLLNFRPLARTIAGIAIGTDGPFTVGVTAKWGHGKTSMLRLIKHLIEEHGRQTDEKWRATHVNVWFNAWQYEGEEQPIVPLLLAIQRAIAKTEEQHRTQVERAKDTAAGWLNGIYMVLFAAMYGLKLKMPAHTMLDGFELDFSKVIDRYEEQTEDGPETSLPVSTIMQVVDALESITEARNDQLPNTLPEDKPKIVVFIDDLDRCHPDTATKLLDGIKLILNQPGFIFVLALDKTIIEEFLIRKYREEFGTTSPSEVGSKYIEKIIQLEFPIPPASELSCSETENYLHALCREILDDLPHERIPAILACFDTLNPRDATRFLLRTRAEYETWGYRGKPRCGVRQAASASVPKDKGMGGDGETADITDAQVLEGLLLLDLIESAFPAAGKQHFVDLCSGPTLCDFVAQLCASDLLPDVSTLESQLVKDGKLGVLAQAVYDSVARVRGLRSALRTYGPVLLAEQDVRNLLRTGFVKSAGPPVGASTGVDASSSSYNIIKEAVRLALGLGEEEWTEKAWSRVTELALPGRSELVECQALAKCTSLRLLDLRDTGVSDVSPLEGLKSLQMLSLGGTVVSDVSPLKGLTLLTSLGLNDTQVSDVSPLKGLTSLTSLDLRGTQVSDVSPLKGLTALQELYLNGTQVSDVSPLKGLMSLYSLNLMGTQVSDVSPLKGLTALTSLDLSGTKVTHSQVAALKQALPRCGIYM